MMRTELYRGDGHWCKYQGKRLGCEVEVQCCVKATSNGEGSILSQPAYLQAIADMPCIDNKRITSQ